MPKAMVERDRLRETFGAGVQQRGARSPQSI
jgi:hypothetical protein